MLLEITLITLVLIVYDRINRDTAFIAPYHAPKRRTAPQLLAHRNNWTQCEVAYVVQQLDKSLGHLVWLMHNPGIMDSNDTFESPMIFEAHEKFVVPITPESPLTPELDHTELYSATVFYLKLLCFELEMMAQEPVLAQYLSTSMSFDNVKVLLNTKETQTCARALMLAINKSLHKG